MKAEQEEPLPPDVSWKKALLFSAGFVFVAAINAVSWRIAPGTLVPLKLFASAQTAVQDVSLSVCGMRRLAADIAFVEFLLYYGTPELAEQEHEEAEEPHMHGEGGVYPELLARGRRILSLDPHFDYAALYIGGALAFNQGRTDEALMFLEEARAREPGNWRFVAYIAAVGFNKTGSMESVLQALAPALADRDCPSMIKNIAAFMNVRLGRYDEAGRLYQQLLDSRDESYRASAKRVLARLSLRRTQPKSMRGSR
ncbi:MAG: tetratricopeptide repeat protein [Elusimicrobiota bacterium]